jgi:hypothetical protein
VFVRYMVVGAYVGCATVGVFVTWYLCDSFLGIDLSQVRVCVWGGHNRVCVWGGGHNRVCVGGVITGCVWGGGCHNRVKLLVCMCPEGVGLISQAGSGVFEPYHATRM